MAAGVRLIKEEDLEKLLALYHFLNPEDPQLKVDHDLKRHWRLILADPNLFYVVAEKDDILLVGYF